MLLQHAYSIRNILFTYKSQSEEIDSLLETLNLIISRLENTATNSSASYDFLVFVINRLPSYEENLTNTQISFEVYTYYYSNMRPALQKELARITIQAGAYQNHKTQFLQQMKLITDKLGHLARIFEKNMQLFLELNAALNTKYKALIKDCVVAKDEVIMIYKELRDKISGCEIKNLQQNKKFLEVKSTVYLRINLVKEKTAHAQQDYILTPLASIADNILDYLSKQQNAQIPNFTGLKHQNELELLEWLLLSQAGLQKQPKKLFRADKSNGFIPFIDLMKGNLISLFSALAINIDGEFIKHQNLQLQHDSATIINRIRNIRYDAVKTMQELMLLKDYMKESGFYLPAEATDSQEHHEQSGTETMSNGLTTFFSQKQLSETTSLDPKSTNTVTNKCQIM